MTISIEDFERGFRALSAAFGSQYSEQRMLVYHETLSPKTPGGLDQWTRAVKGMVMSMSNMPKLAEILSLPDFRGALGKPPSLQLWVNDLCRVKDCFDGFVSRDIKGFSVLFACPECERYKTNTFPITAIPTAKRWQGKYDSYTTGEMEGRRRERQGVVDAMRDQAARKIDWNEAVEEIFAI